MIIIEGVDKAGKSTLAKLIAFKWNLPIEKYGVPKGDPIPEYHARLNEIDDVVIFDRFIYGEIPYSIVKKRQRYMGYLEFKMLDLMVQSIPHLVIYVRPHRNVISQRLKDEGDDYINFEEMYKIYEEYDELMADSTANMVIYGGDNLEYVMNRVTAVIGSRHEWIKYRHWKNKGMPGIGTLRPEYLFVGERYNANAKYQTTFWSPAGEFLLHAIELAGIKLNNCHFTNAISPNFEDLTSDQLGLVEPSKGIICLGQVAKTVLGDIKKKYPHLNVHAVRHPAYFLRFVSRNPFHYAEEILKCGLFGTEAHPLSF